MPGDPTPPVVTPVITGTLGDAAWYTSNVTVNWSILDPESIILSTTGCNTVTFTTNTTGTQLTCSAESDGGTTTVSKLFKVDKTAPSTSATPSRAPDTNGWYNHDLTVAFNGADSTSGLHSCTAPEAYGGPDTTSTTVSGTCRDIAGNVAPAALPLQYDETSPQASPAARPPDRNGWFNHAVTVTFQGADATSGIQSCAQVTYDGPDDPSVALSGTCVDHAGNKSSSSVFTLKYDETAPLNGGGSPSRGADTNGWYNQAFTITFQGSDATSGIETCTQVNYTGPDNANASVSGFCRDIAGNQSGTSAFAFKYDASAPSLVSLTVKPGNRSAVLTWNASPDTSLVEIVRTAGTRGLGVTVYRGTGRSFRDTRLENGVRYHYMLRGYDEARNVATKQAAATPMAPLFAPRAGATVSAPPELVWRAVEKATYYNVQVWRRGKIFSAWPDSTSVQLRREWKYAGRSYRLTPGRYNWYVWPGYGRRAQKKFGPLLGSSSFVVKAPRR